MDSYAAAPFQTQDVDEITEMLRGLGSCKGKSGFSCKKHTYTVEGSSTKVDSWRLQDWDYKKQNLPTYARGLFTTRNAHNQPEIAVRGYDKFFNHGEVRDTEWANVEANTRGPYELSVKENGCIIFIAGLEDGTLLVCSKHSTGPRDDVERSHSSVGERWVDKHLAGVGKTRQDLARRLRQMNATAVAELCDDDFEEHVLAYSPDTAGLYLHGINLNLPTFATYPHHLVDRFADEWGFRKTTYIVKDDINDVKTFLDHVAETGNFEGRDTEGFVIRCQSKAHTGEWHDWFFKYKFEEPYLMYRQWRECTKAIIAGRQPKFKKHKKITEEYLAFARAQLHRNEALKKAYNANHGIIKMRDDFLASRGLKGSDIIRQEEQEGEVADSAVTHDVVLVPVATIGCGKTTVALGLCKLFGWGHVQNDNITAKKGKPQLFVNKCAQALEAHPAMVADRNNHQRRERKQLIEDMTKVVADARFVALHYVHDRANHDSVRETTRARVLNRGDNHQTIQAASKDPRHIIEIMEGFMSRFEPVDQDVPPDDGFDLVIDLDPLASSRDNLDTAVSKLYGQYPALFEGRDMPTAEAMDAAIADAMNEYTVDIRHEIGGRNDGEAKARGNNGNNKPAQQQQQQQQHQAKAKQRKIEYFGVQVDHAKVDSVLEAAFAGVPADVSARFRALKDQRRVQTEFHVTLIHRSASGGAYAEQWTRLSELYAHKCDQLAMPDPPLGRSNVRLERLVWNARLMAFVVRLHPVDSGGDGDSDGSPSGNLFRSVNAAAHITVGTMSPDIKPKESNDLLARWLREGSGDNGIQELAIKGTVELEGTVKAVLAR